MPGPSPQELLADATARLAAAGVPSPRTDAELLLAHVLGVARGRLPGLRGVGPQQAADFAHLVLQRAERVPLQHLTGEAPFRHLLLHVGPGVFVPRPETELLVDAVLPHLAALAAPSVVDLCAGSGALAIALAQEAPHARVRAVERAPEAHAALDANAAAHGVRLVQQLEADVRQLRHFDHLFGTVDVVVANPPYVPAAAPVAPEVRHDPAEAVFAGADGLAVIPAVAELAALLLRAGGLFAMEHDDSQGESVPALLRGSGWVDVEDHRDLAGRPRFVTAVRA